MTYTAWLRAVDQECARLWYGLDLDSVFGDQMTRQAFDDDVTPQSFMAELGAPE